jgi:hypothetical protein
VETPQTKITDVTKGREIDVGSDRKRYCIVPMCKNMENGERILTSATIQKLREHDIPRDSIRHL